MTIVNINPHYQDGLGYQDYYLCKEFIKMGHQVIQITSDQHFNYPDYENTVQHIIGPKYVGHGLFKSEFGMPIHRLKVSFKLMGKLWMKGLYKKLKELKPDLIFCHGIFNFYSYFIAKYAIKNKIPVIYDDHTTSNYRNYSKIAELSYAFFRKKITPSITKSAVKIVGISSSVMPFIKNDLGCKTKLEEIGLGADTEIFYKSNAERKLLRNELKITDDTILILYTGKIYADKQLEQIPDAIKQIDLQNKNICWLIVGDVAAPYKANFEALLANKEIKTIYHKSVPTTELRKYYNAADIACWPAHATGSTVDASACGCPIICNNMMAERYAFGNGFGVLEGNTNDLKNALNSLIFDKALRETMGKKGIEYVQQKLSWSAIAKQFLTY